MAESRYVFRDGSKNFGPVDGQQLIKLVSAGRVKPETLVRPASSSEWQPAWKLDFLADALPRDFARPPDVQPTAPERAAPETPADPPIDESHPLAPVVMELRRQHAIMSSINDKMTFFVWLTVVSIGIAIFGAIVALNLIIQRL